MLCVKTCQGGCEAVSTDMSTGSDMDMSSCPLYHNVNTSEVMKTRGIRVIMCSCDVEKACH